MQHYSATRETQVQAWPPAQERLGLAEVSAGRALGCKSPCCAAPPAGQTGQAAGSPLPAMGARGKVQLHDGDTPADCLELTPVQLVHGGEPSLRQHELMNQASKP